LLKNNPSGLKAVNVSWTFQGPEGSCSFRRGDLSTALRALKTGHQAAFSESERCGHAYENTAQGLNASTILAIFGTNEQRGEKARFEGWNEKDHPSGAKAQTPLAI
jgi:hypothetical protein